MKKTKKKKFEKKEIKETSYVGGDYGNVIFVGFFFYAHRLENNDLTYAP
jgi:hypothetical protein